MTITIGNILELIPAFNALNEQSKFLSAKAKWNLALNIKRCGEVARSFEEQRIECFKKHAPIGAQKIQPSDSGWDGYQKEVGELLKVETDTKILRFAFDEIVRDDLQISSDLIAQLEPLLDGKPE